MTGREGTGGKLLYLFYHLIFVIRISNAKLLSAGLSEEASKQLDEVDVKPLADALFKVTF